MYFLPTMFQSNCNTTKTLEKRFCNKQCKVEKPDKNKPIFIFFQNYSSDDITDKMFNVCM